MSGQAVAAKSTALVLARTERRRMLRELLALSEWTAVLRVRYAELIRQEWLDTSKTSLDDAIRASGEAAVFGHLLGAGIDMKTALEEAKGMDPPLDQTEGQRERERRRWYREAVTAFDARSVVTLGGPMSKCLVCGEPLSPWRRRDRVYCDAACKMRAARMRKREAS